MTHVKRDAGGRFAPKNGTNGAHAQNSDLSEVLDRAQFANRVGIQYGGARDVYGVAGYKKSPEFADFWAYYDRHPIAARIVDLPAKTTWRYAPELVEPGKEEGTDFTAKFEDLADRIGLWGRLEKVDRLSRIGQFAVLLIGAKGGESLAAPLSRMSGSEDVAFLMQYSQRWVRIKSLVTDTSDERFGLPEIYEIDLARGGARNSGLRKEAVHWSRVLHVAEDTLEEDVHGRPILRRVLNTIFNDEKVDAASAEAFWQLADQILQLKIDPNANVTETQLEQIDEEMGLLYHNLRRMFSSKGGELSWLGGETPDPSAISKVLAEKMAAGAGIPVRILYGSERGELASSQDERNWIGSIVERQAHHAGPNLVRAFVDRLIDFGALPRPGAEGYKVQWPNLYQPTDKEVSERNAATATAASTLTPVGGDPLELVKIDEDGNVWLRTTEEIWEEREAAEEETRRLMEEGLLPTPPGLVPDPEGEEDEDASEEAAA